jgi:hypothetical protein
MSVTLKVQSDDAAIEAQRERLARRVIERFDSSLSASGSPLCYLDDRDDCDLRSKFGPANRGVYLPVHDIGQLDGWPSYVRKCIYPSDRTGQQSRAYDELVYLHGSTCADEVGLAMTLAHELQHAVQHAKVRQLWAVNSLLTGGEKIVNGLKQWKDIPIEFEARIVSKRLVEDLFGEQRVDHYIGRKIAEKIDRRDVADWKFVRMLDSSSTIDVASETRQLLERIKAAGCWTELKNQLKQKSEDPDYADIDLDSLLDSLQRLNPL